MKIKNLLALLCAAVLMAASAACNAGSGDTAQLTSPGSAPVSDQAPVSREADSRPVETSAPAESETVPESDAALSGEEAETGLSSQPADESWGICHLPRAPEFHQEPPSENPSEAPSAPTTSFEEAPSTLPQESGIVDPSFTHRTDPSTSDIATSAPPKGDFIYAEMDRLTADAKAHGDLALETRIGSVAAVPEQRVYPVGTARITASIVVNRPGLYCFVMEDNAYILQKLVDGQWVTVPAQGENPFTQMPATLEGDTIGYKSYDLGLCDPAWMTAGEYRILDGDGLEPGSGMEDAHFTFSFSLAEG